MDVLLQWSQTAFDYTNYGLDELKNQHESFTEMVAEIIDLAIEDYKTGTCETNLKKFSIISSPSPQISLKWITVPLIILSIIVTCCLFIKCKMKT